MTVCLAEIVQKQSHKDKRKKGKISLSVPTPALTWKRKRKAKRWETEKREQVREERIIICYRCRLLSGVIVCAWSASSARLDKQRQH